MHIPLCQIAHSQGCLGYRRFWRGPEEGSCGGWRGIRNDSAWLPRVLANRLAHSRDDTTLWPPADRFLQGLIARSAPPFAGASLPQTSVPSVTLRDPSWPSSGQGLGGWLASVDG